MNELLVIGCRAGSPGLGSPASGYILNVGGTTFLVDCGPGVVAALAARGLVSQLSGVIITHAHANHCADLIALAYHRLFPEKQSPLPLFGPASLKRVLEALNATFGIPSLDDLKAPVSTAFSFSILKPESRQKLLGVDIQTHRTQHPIETLALKLPELHFIYTADGALTEGLVAFARGADVLLAEATYLDEAGHDLIGHGHMTAAGAGEFADRTGAHKLVLTHFSDLSEADMSCERARQVFSGDVISAKPDLRVPLRTIQEQDS